MAELRNLHMSFYLLFVFFINQSVFVRQSSGIDVLQTAVDSVLATRESLISSMNTHLKKLIPTERETSIAGNDVHLELKNGSESDVIPQNTLSSTGQLEQLLNFPIWKTSNSSFSGHPDSKSVQGFIDNMIVQPVQDRGAEVVEGAVKTGVDQAISSMSGNFKFNIVFVVAVFVIQFILFICGAQLWFYVYMKEKEMQRFAKKPRNSNDMVVV